MCRCDARFPKGPERGSAEFSSFSELSVRGDSKSAVYSLPGSDGRPSSDACARHGPLLSELRPEPSLDERLGSSAEALPGIMACGAPVVLNKFIIR